MELTTNKCVFKVTNKVKQTRLGTHITPLQYLAYPNDDKLCVVTHLKEYLTRSGVFRNGNTQFLAM